MEEKKQGIIDYCRAHRLCTDGSGCPLYNCVNPCWETEDSEIIDMNFALISAAPDYNGQRESIEDVVNHPSHYTQGNIECIDAMEAAFGKEAVANFCICNAFKYIFRHEHKNGKEDIEKAEWYLNRYKKLKYDEAEVS